MRRRSRTSYRRGDGELHALIHAMGDYSDPLLRCPTGKTCYATDVDSKLALAKIAYQDKVGHVERRSYQCDQCSWWHLTSKPLYKEGTPWSKRSTT